MAIFIQHRTQSIHKVGALMEKALPGSVQDSAGLLIFRLRLDKTHLGTLCCNDDCFSIGSIVFLPFTKGRTHCGAISFTSSPTLTISRAQWLALPHASIRTTAGA